MATKKIATVAEGSLFLLLQVIFCVGFLASCEVPNWTNGPRSPSECVDRWMFASGLIFVPSGIGTVAGRSIATSRHKQSLDSSTARRDPDTNE